ncbi:small integral membrane protein 24 isoform X1 [Hyaena hyaena]|uniref:small integral membrane protein 24 isoform X1 n=1 Tax=Hyaena hyaena TaxID=95912 RepID=UPI001921F1DE|nr:small integral membrane protein 24 isoform X1 [Hyaena hyaena]
MGTLGTLFLLGALLLSPAEAQEAAPPRLKPWLVGLAALVVFLFIVFVLMLANRIWCSKVRDGDEESRLRMEANPYQDVSEEGKRKKEERVKGDEAEEEEGERNAGLELDEKEGPRDEEKLTNTAV